MRIFAIGTLAALAALAFAAPAQAATLKPQIEVSGSAVTLGDIFLDAGDAAGRAVAPAPAPGQRTMLSAKFIAGAAAAAGLNWTPPAGLDRIAVDCISSDRVSAVRSGEARSGEARAQPAAFRAEAPTGVKRGDTVTLVYVSPGLQLTTRAKALSDANVGAAVKLVNIQSNKPVDAVVTAPGVAAAGGAQSF